MSLLETTILSPGILAGVFAYRYALLYILTLVEGPLATLAAGFLISLKLMDWRIAFPIVIAGDVSGDIVIYYIGRFSDRWRLTRAFTKWFRLEPRKEEITRSFASRGGRFLIFGKLTHAVGIVFLLGAGYARMNLLRFIWYSILGTAIKSGALLYMGYIAGTAYGRFYNYLEYGSLVLAVVLIAFVFVFYYVSSRLRSVKEGPSGPRSGAE